MRKLNIDKQFLYNLLSSVNNQLIGWSHILGFTPKLKQFVNSPFREDNNPNSCWLEIYNNSVVLTDYADNRFHNIGLYKAFALKYPHLIPQQIFNLIADVIFSNNLLISQIENSKNKIKKHLSYTIRTKNKKPVFKKSEEEYWNSYGITLKQLISDNVYSCEEIIINDVVTKNKEMSFVMLLQDKFKIYNPLNEKYKWLSSTNNNNYWYIKNDSDTIIITTSYKDARVISNVFGYSSFAPVSETAKLNFNQQQLIESYKKTIVIGDGDATGDKFATYYNSFYGYDYVIFPEEYRKEKNKYNKKIKDVSELYRFSEQLVKNLL